MPGILDKLKSAAVGAYDAAVEGVQSYLKPDIAAAAANFDAKESQRKREESAAKVKRLDEAAAKGQRVSGRARSRARDIARVEGRSDEEKIRSQAVSDRNHKVLIDTALTVAPGGAAAGYAAKAGKIAKAAKYARAAGQGSLKEGVKRLATNTAKKVARQGLKKSAKKAGTAALKTAKYVAKTKAQGKLNQVTGGVAGNAIG